MIEIIITLEQCSVGIGKKRLKRRIPNNAGGARKILYQCLQTASS